MQARACALRAEPGKPSQAKPLVAIAGMGSVSLHDEYVAAIQHLVSLLRDAREIICDQMPVEFPSFESDAADAISEWEGVF